VKERQDGRQEGVWWSVSCCSDGEVDDVSEGDGGGFEERKKKVRERGRPIRKTPNLLFVLFCTFITFFK